MANKLDAEARRRIYEKSKVTAGNVQIALSNPALKSKLRSDIEVDSNVVYWYIRFNLALNPRTVNKKTATVTERNGFIVPTDIKYDSAKHVISIEPTDCYAQNEYYILNITRKVKSERGNPLKNPVYILFKLMGTEITEFKILPKGTDVPPPKRRPKGYVPDGVLVYPPSVDKAYTFDRAKFDALPDDKLPYQSFSLNPLLAVLGIAAAVAAVVIGYTPLFLGSMALCAGGIVHVVFQLSRAKTRSILSYNSGAMKFNAGKYEKARKSFLKAAKLDDMNEYAEYACAKVVFFI